MSSKLENQQVQKKRLERDQHANFKNDSVSDDDNYDDQIPQRMKNLPEDEREDLEIELATVKLDVRKNRHNQAKFIIL